MKNYDKIEEITEFKIIDKEKIKKKLRKIEKSYPQIANSIKYVEPFEKLVGKIAVVPIHSLDLIQFYEPEKVWYLDTRTYDVYGKFLYKFIYRWKFTNGLPKKLINVIGHNVIIKLNYANIIVNQNTCIELPGMYGKVEIVKEKFDRNKDNEFFVINPEIMNV